MALILWGRTSSCNVQKALWALAEVGVDYAHIPLGGDHGGLDDPDYLAMNPTARVPTLRDGKQIIWESDTVVRYLAEHYGRARLFPDSFEGRIEADKWMTWTAATLYRPWIDLFWSFVRQPPELHDKARIDALHQACIKHYRFLDGQLAQRSYLAGERFSMADIPAGMTLYRWYEMEIERPDLPHLAAWYERLLARPAYREGVCIPFDELKGKQGF